MPDVEPTTAGPTAAGPTTAGPTTVRIATAADVPAIRAIYNDAILTTTATWDTEPQTLAARAEWFADHVREGQPVWVAERDGRVVGYAAWGPLRDRPGYRHTREHSLYVDAAARGSGVGTLLLRTVVNEARDAGVHALIGVLSADNEASLMLHRAFGFVEVARLPETGRKFGRWLDLVCVQLLLPGPADPDA